MEVRMVGRLNPIPTLLREMKPDIMVLHWVRVEYIIKKVFSLIEQKTILPVVHLHDLIVGVQLCLKIAVV
jgi:hypothetical protein